MCMKANDSRLSVCSVGRIVFSEQLTICIGLFYHLSYRLVGNINITYLLFGGESFFLKFFNKNHSVLFDNFRGRPFEAFVSDLSFFPRLKYTLLPSSKKHLECTLILLQNGYNQCSYFTHHYYYFFHIVSYKK